MSAMQVAQHMKCLITAQRSQGLYQTTIRLLLRMTLYISRVQADNHMTRLRVRVNGLHHNNYNIEVGNGSNLNIEVNGGNINLTTLQTGADGGDVNINASRDLNMQVARNMNVNIIGNNVENVAGKKDEFVIGDNTKTGKNINLN